MSRHCPAIYSGPLSELKQKSAPVCPQEKILLLRSDSISADGLFHELLDHRHRVHAIFNEESVESTNHAAERSLRHAVICRTLSSGMQRASGSRFVETLLLAIENCHQQGHDVFARVTAAVQSRFAGQPCPSLLPGV